MNYMPSGKENMISNYQMNMKNRPVHETQNSQVKSKCYANVKSKKAIFISVNWIDNNNATAYKYIYTHIQLDF